MSNADFTAHGRIDNQILTSKPTGQRTLDSRLPTHQEDVDPGGPSTADTSAALVTQADLQEIEDFRQYQPHVNQLRKAMIARLDAGAAIEPGRLSAVVRENESRSFSAAKLEFLIGADRVAQLKERIDPTVSRQLIIEPAPSTQIQSKLSVMVRPSRLPLPTVAGTTIIGTHKFK